MGVVLTAIRHWSQNTSKLAVHVRKFTFTVSTVTCTHSVTVVGQKINLRFLMFGCNENGFSVAAASLYLS